MAPVLTRRALLLGALGSGVVTGCSTGPSAYRVAGTLVTGSFRSAARNGTTTGWAVVYPPGHGAAGGRSLRVLVVLHGRGGDHRDAYESLHLDRYLAAVVGNGTKPFALASVDGGDHDYWHARRATGDAAAMVVHEFLPLLAHRGLDVSRIALLGWSMGGYGALYLASVLRAPRVAAVVAESPAIWHHGEQSVAGAFDDAQDFDRHAIFSRLRSLDGIATRLDCGDRDGFAVVTRDLHAALHPPPAGGIEPGGHDPTFWRSQATAQLTFAGRHLG